MPASNEKIFKGPRSIFTELKGWLFQRVTLETRGNQQVTSTHVFINSSWIVCVCVCVCVCDSNSLERDTFCSKYTFDKLKFCVIMFICYYCFLISLLLKSYSSPCDPALQSKRCLLWFSRSPLSHKGLAQELMMRKCEDVGTKNICWVEKMVTT